MFSVSHGEILQKGLNRKWFMIAPPIFSPYLVFQATRGPRWSRISMPNKPLTLWILLGLLIAAVHASVPTTALYPFSGYDLTELRGKAKAESRPATTELSEAWTLYRELQGCWMPGAPKPQAQTLARLDKLKKQLEELPQPRWFTEALTTARPVSVKLADKIGDSEFKKQIATPEYQGLKALVLIYLSEHELDRAGAAQKAGPILTALIITHPWDWQLHALNGRLLLDAQQYAPALGAASQSLFLDPEPDLGTLKFFAFVGSVAAKEKWPEIQDAIRVAALDQTTAEQAIKESTGLYTENAKVNVVQPK